MKNRIIKKILLFSVSLAVLSALFIISNFVKLFTSGLIIDLRVVLRIAILLLFFISGIGLLKLKKWAYVFILILSIYGLSSGFILLFLSMLETPPFGNVQFSAIITAPHFGILNITNMVYLLILVFLLFPSNRHIFITKERESKKIK